MDLRDLIWVSFHTICIECVIRLQVSEPVPHLCQVSVTHFNLCLKCNLTLSDESMSWVLELSSCKNLTDDTYPSISVDCNPQLPFNKLYTFTFTLSTHSIRIFFKYESINMPLSKLSLTSVFRIVYEVVHFTVIKCLLLLPHSG